MQQIADNAARFRPRYDELRSGRVGREPGWLGDIRAIAMARFAELGMPTTEQEEWRATPIHPIVETAFGPAPAKWTAASDALDARWSGPFPGPRAALVNGRLAPDLCRLGGLPKGVRVVGLAELLATDPDAAAIALTSCSRYENQAFTALNTALFEDGVAIVLDRGAVLDEPLHVAMWSTGAGAPTASHPRILVIAGENSRVGIIETYSGELDAVYLMNPVTEIVVGENARVDHCRLQDDGARAFHVGELSVRVGRTATLTSHTVALGAAIARLDVNATFAEEGGHCELNGLYLTRGAQLVDNHTMIDHARPNCTSRQLYKGVLSDEARGVFNGRVYVRPDAQKTDARQTNQALLLSEEAQIHTNPQLEIYADDVKCTHGAAVGQLNADALFYLRSRGIGTEEARGMLVHAFAQDMVDRVPIASFREYLNQVLSARLAGLQGA